MLTRHCLIACLATTPLSALASEVLHIDGARSERDIACEDGQDVSVTGAQHKLSLTGRCGAVEIRGSRHVVSFETARSLYVTGIDNAATGESVAKLSVDASRNRVVTGVKAHDGSAEIEVAGAEQALQLTLGSPVKISVHGARNRVRWQAGAGVKAPAVSISGIENSVARR